MQHAVGASTQYISRSFQLRHRTSYFTIIFFVFTNSFILLFVEIRYRLLCGKTQNKSKCNLISHIFRIYVRVSKVTTE